MFENIIGHQALLEDLKRELTQKRFPPSVLFYGPTFSGKLSTALEVARILSCSQQADWACECLACKQQRLLCYPYTILCGSRHTLPEIRAAQDVLARTRSLASSYLYLRALRKLTRRFDPHIFAVEESRKKEIETQLLLIEENLQELEPPQELPADDQLRKLFKVLEGFATKLESFLPQDNLPIAFVRNLEFWVYHSAAAERKVILIENASRMQEASRNALLKILEEPPPQTTFILLTEKREELIPTIRSRLRAYRFLRRSPEEEEAVLRRVFKETNPSYRNLKDYFLAWEDIQLNLLRSQAYQFLEKAFSSKPVIIRKELPELFSRDRHRHYYKFFLEEVINLLQKVLADQKPVFKFPAPPLARIVKMHKLITERFREFQSLNLAPGLFLESLFLALKDVA